MISRLATILLAVLAFGAGPAVASTATHAPNRACPEDTVWMGTGDFQGTTAIGGYWSHYKCVTWDSVKREWRRAH
jgi:hypothetical protein